MHTVSSTAACRRAQGSSCPGQDLLLTAVSVLAGPLLLGCAHLILRGGLAGLRTLEWLPWEGLPVPAAGSLRSVEELLGLLAAVSGLFLSLLSGLALTAALLHAALERRRPPSRHAGRRSPLGSFHAGAALISPAFMRRAAAAVLGAQFTLLGTTGAAPVSLPESSPVPAQTSPLLPVEGHPDERATTTPLFRPMPPGSADRSTGSSPREDAEEAQQITVRSGDSLWEIVAEHLGPEATAWEIAREWPRWHRANEEAIGPDPELLRPGTVLSVPQDHR